MDLIVWQMTMLTIKLGLRLVIWLGYRLRADPSKWVTVLFILAAQKTDPIFGVAYPLPARMLVLEFCALCALVGALMALFAGPYTTIVGYDPYGRPYLTRKRMNVGDGWLKSFGSLRDHVTGKYWPGAMSPDDMPPVSERFAQFWQNRYDRRRQAEDQAGVMDGLRRKWRWYDSLITAPLRRNRQTGETYEHETDDQLRERVFCDPAAYDPATSGDGEVVDAEVVDDSAELPGSPMQLTPAGPMADDNREDPTS